MGVVNNQNQNPFWVSPNATTYPVIQSSGTVNVYYAQQSLGQAAPASPQEKAPLDWLRGEVDEMRELARAA